MLSYILRRLLGVIPVMVVVGVFVFSLLHLAPGDPAAIIAGDNATEASIAAGIITTHATARASGSD